MNTKNLMVGDKVLIADKITKKSLVKKVNVATANGVVVHGCKILFSSDEVLPIPLTQEIVEANGFEKQTPRKKRAVVRWMLVLNPDTPQLALVSWVKNGNVKITYHDSAGVWVKAVNMRLNYVHELQHALRLCGMGDIADKLKVV